MQTLSLSLHARHPFKLSAGLFALLVAVLLITSVAAQPTHELRLDAQADGAQITLSGDTTLLISLEGQIATGYLWTIDEHDPAILRPLSPPELSPTTQSWRFQALAAGETTLSLGYRRPWEPAEVASVRHFTLSVQTTAPFLPFTPVEPTPSPPPAENLPPTSLTPSSLPSRFNWCADGYCTPIKDQRRCGGCWAFTTNGVMEAAIKIHDGVTRDLSEQYLISCNTNNWGCEKGGWYAFDYYINRFAPNQPQAGAVYTQDFAYQAADVACASAYPHHEQLTSWHYVDPNPRTRSSVQSTESIKQAIATYGPVASSVCVGDAFAGYTGGTFSTNEASSCGNANINHGVVLVGWDDSEGVWIMRNSWGTWWGEEGYMRITYGNSNIGFATAYVVYTPSEQPTPSAPAAPSALSVNACSSSTIALTWHDNSANESGFYLERAREGGSWQLIATLAANTTSFNDSGLNSSTNYSYRVSAFNEHGTSASSPVVSAQTLAESNPEPDPAAPLSRSFLPLVVR
jgi:predicted secreted protein